MSVNTKDKTIVNESATVIQLEKMKALEESTKNVPRFLFRAFSSTSGGGAPGLNSTEAIVPHAFLKGKGHKTIHEIPYQRLGSMVCGHLSGQLSPLSEFSSWAASMPMVCDYALTMPEGAHVCIVDRYKLPKHQKIYHVRSMLQAGLSYGPYDVEYLAHGIIMGPGFKAVSLQKLQELGLYREVPSIVGGVSSNIDGGYYNWWIPFPTSIWESAPITPMKAQHIQKLKTIAEAFGPDFTLLVTAALSTIDRRGADKDGMLLKEDIETFSSVIEDLDVPEEYGSKESIVMDGIFTTGFPTICQMVQLLRGLVAYRYGKGARSRQKKRIEDLTEKMKQLSLPKGE